MIQLTRHLSSNITRRVASRPMVLIDVATALIVTGLLFVAVTY